MGRCSAGEQGIPVRFAASGEIIRYANVDDDECEGEGVLREEISGDLRNEVAKLLVVSPEAVVVSVPSGRLRDGIEVRLSPEVVLERLRQIPGGVRVAQGWRRWESECEVCCLKVSGWTLAPLEVTPLWWAVAEHPDPGVDAAHDLLREVFALFVASDGSREPSFVCRYCYRTEILLWLQILEVYEALGLRDSAVDESGQVAKGAELMEWVIRVCDMPEEQRRWPELVYRAYGLADEEDEEGDEALKQGRDEHRDSEARRLRAGVFALLPCFEGLSLEQRWFWTAR